METLQHLQVIIIQVFQDKSDIVVHKVKGKQNYIFKSIYFMVWVWNVILLQVSNMFHRNVA